MCIVELVFANIASYVVEWGRWGRDRGPVHMKGVEEFLSICGHVDMSRSNPTGDGVYTIHQRKRHQEVQAHLTMLLDSDPAAFWIVVLDWTCPDDCLHIWEEIFPHLPTYGMRVFLSIQCHLRSLFGVP